MLFDPLETITTTISLWTSFNGARTSPDLHLEAFLANYECDDDEREFIETVFLGMFRFKKLLQLTQSAFYFRHHPARSDSNIYLILIYIVLFRLQTNEQVADFSNVVSSLAPLKMSVFLHFFCNKTTIQEWLHDEWITLYDEQFVTAEVIDPLIAHLPHLSKIEAKVSNRLAFSQERDDTTAAEAGKRAGLGKTTKPQGFNLTKPKPRSLPKPEIQPRVIKARKVPEAVKRGPVTLQKTIEKTKKKNQEKAASKVEEAEKNQFSVARKDKIIEAAKKKEALAQKLIDEEDSRINMAIEETKKMSKTPPVSTNVQVHLNAAAVIREEALYRRKLIDEEERLSKLEQGQRDSSEFDQWQAKMKKQDEDAVFEAIAMRRAEALLSHEEAQIAKETRLAINQEAVFEEREEKLRVQTELAYQKEIDDIEKRKQNEAIAKISENAKQAQIETKWKKQKEAERMSEDLEIMLEEARREREQEKMILEQRIKEIRASQHAPKKKGAEFDPSKPIGYGLMAEMSFNEMRKRVQEIKSIEAQERESKRDSILEAKLQNEEKMGQRLQAVARRRFDAEQEARQKRQAKAEQQNSKKEKEAKIREASVLALAAKLQNKRQERAKTIVRLRDERREALGEARFRAAGRKQVEHIKWKAHERLQESGALSRQTAKQKEDLAVANLASAETRIRVEASAKSQNDTIARNTAYSHRVAVQTLQAQRAVEDELFAKKERVRAQRENEIATRKKEFYKRDIQ